MANRRTVVQMAKILKSASPESGRQGSEVAASRFAQSCQPLTSGSFARRYQPILGALHLQLPAGSVRSRLSFTLFRGSSCPRSCLGATAHCFVGYGDAPVLSEVVGNPLSQDSKLYPAIVSSRSDAATNGRASRPQANDLVLGSNSVLENFDAPWRL